jgi:hypothetical protein
LNKRKEVFMPRKVLLTETGFNELAAKFTGADMQFRRIPNGEFFHDKERLGLIGPGTKTGVQEKFIFYERGFKVVVLTTYIPKLGTCRLSDCGRVIILKGDQIVYMSRDIRRTKNFATRLLRYAWIAKWKISHRPLCPECSAHMDIAHKKYRQQFWICTRKESHSNDKNARRDWDYELPKKAKKFLTGVRKESEKYRTKRKKAGKIPFAGLRKRKTWKRTKEKNIDRS